MLLIHLTMKTVNRKQIFFLKGMLTMRQELLHEYGLNELGILINAKDASKGVKYFCPGCNAVFILKKSGNTGSGSRRPHFAHNTAEHICSYESYLHKTFILRTVEFLKDRLKNNQPIEVHWACNICKMQHNVNLVGFSGVKSEFSLKERKPDIALFDQSGNVIVVIEIIYKHPPEDGAIQFYRKHNIHVIQIIISSENDLNNIEQKIKKPTSFDLCILPKIPQAPLLVPALQKRRSSNGIPSDLLDNPNKYYSHNGKFYRKKGRSRLL